MKKSFKLFTLLLASAAMLMVGCKPAEDLEAGLETKIKSIEITNAGISGGDIIKGVVDDEALTVTFENVPAETDISAIKFSAKRSLGANLEGEVFNFAEGVAADAMELRRQIKVVNHVVLADNSELNKEQEFTFIIKLKAAEKAPLITKVVYTDDQDKEYTATAANIIDDALCLGIPESTKAKILSVSINPARGSYSLTQASDDGEISATNPGELVTDFMGVKAVYRILFVASPKPGAAWEKAVVHDFSVVSGNMYADFSEELTRGGDFDGQYVLIANRTAPKLLKIEDLLSDNANNPILLDQTGVEGGTHVISAGRLAQGHVYLCNLATACGADMPLKVYHYATPTSKPDVVLSWDGTGLENPDPEIYDEYSYKSRIGDNLSISLDENGNGYAFFFKQEADQKFFRFTVRNFTEFSEPKELALPAISNYYAMMNPVGENQYIVKSSYKEVMWLLNADAEMIRDLTWQETPNGYNSAHACDPRIIEFNHSRFIMLMNARRFGWWKPEGVNVYDISEGSDLVAALVNLQAHLDYDPDEPEPGTSPIEPCFNYTMDSGTISSACVSLCNCAVVDGKLLIFCAAPHVGFAIIEVPRAE